MEKQLCIEIEVKNKDDNCVTSIRTDYCESILADDNWEKVKFKGNTGVYIFDKEKEDIKDTIDLKLYSVFTRESAHTKAWQLCSDFSTIEVRIIPIDLEYLVYLKDDKDENNYIKIF